MRNTLPAFSYKTNRQVQFSIDLLSLNHSLQTEVPVSNDHFEIIWITKGSGQVKIDLRDYPMDNQQLFMITPGEVYLLQPADVLEGFIISFSESFLDTGFPEFDATHHASLFDLLSGTKGVSINTDVVADMKIIADIMMREYKDNNLFKTEMLRRYFKIFLIYLTRQFEGSFQTNPQTRNDELAQKFLSLVDKNYRTQKMVADYATLLSITPNYLNEIVKKTTGHSAGHHIRQRIVLEAKRKAAYSDTCMKEIAYYLGFCDMAHFSKFFKNTTGKNFTEFKKERIVFSSLQPA